MEYSEFILIVNIASVIILLVMALLLCLAARFKSESSYATMIILVSTVPIYVYNILRSLEFYEVAVFFAPISFSVNLTLMPFLWLLVQRGFNPYYKFTTRQMLHFLPAALSMIVFCVSLFPPPPPLYEHCNFMIHNEKCENKWLADVNYLILQIQFLAYSFVIFRYLRKVKHFVRSHYSTAELQRKVWIPRFITFFAILLAAIMMCYAIWPQANTWLFQLFTVFIMGYLLYSELAIAFLERNNSRIVTATVADEAEFIATEVKSQPQSKTDELKKEMQKLEQYARKMEEYLRTSEAYINPNLSLKDVASATSITSKNLSKAINVILGKNFFDVVNGFRVEKSKELLLSKKEKGLTLETIAEQCGFNSRFTLSAAFKKTVGVTTSNWLKQNQNEKLL